MKKHSFFFWLSTKNLGFLEKHSLFSKPQLFRFYISWSRKWFNRYPFMGCFIQESWSFAWNQVVQGFSDHKTKIRCDQLSRDWLGEPINLTLDGTSNHEKGVCNINQIKYPKDSIKPTIWADKGVTTTLLRCCSDPKVNTSHFIEPKVPRPLKPFLPIVAPNP